MRRTRIGLAVCAMAMSVAAGIALAKETTFKSKSYEVVSDLSREELDPLVKRMDLVAAEYARRFSAFHQRDGRPSALRLYRTQDAYLKHLADQGFDGSNTAGVFYVGGMAFPTLAARTEGNPRGRLFHVLQHEGFHQFLYTRLGNNVPVWANEGLAEYFGYGIEVRGRLKVGIAPPSVIHSIQTATAKNQAFGFGEFIRMSDAEWGRRVTSGDARAGIMYDQAWSIAHFLIHAENGKYADRFQQFLAATGEGSTVDQALKIAFGSSDVSPFENAWRQYIAELEPDPIATAVERLEFLGEGLLALHGMDVRPTTIEDLKRELVARDFRWIVPTHASVRIFEAKDDSLYTAPDSAKGKAGSIAMEPAAAPGSAKRRSRRGRDGADDVAAPAMPMDIVITGQPMEIRLTWFRDGEGEPAYEVRFK